MKKFILFCLIFLFICALSACSNTEREDGSQVEQETSLAKVENMQTEKSAENTYTVDTLISDVLADPVFGEYEIGRASCRERV